MKISDYNGKRIIKIAAVIIAMYWVSQNLIYAGVFFSSLVDVSFPIVLGGVIAFILNLPMNFFEVLLKKYNKVKVIDKIKRPLALILSIVSIIGIITIILVIVVPEIINALNALSKTIPQGYDNIINWLNQYSDKIPQIERLVSDMDPDWSSIAQNLMNFTTSGVAGVFDTTFSLITLVAGSVVTFIMAFILAIYMVMSKEKMANQMTRFLTAYFPEKVRNICFNIGKTANESFSNYIVGKCIDAVIVGIMCTIGMLILQLPYAAMIGVIVGVTALVPIIGGYIGLIVGAFLILMINPMQSFEFIVFLLIMQTFEGNVIYPKILGTTIGLPAMWILGAVMIGGSLMGVVGMLISVPIVSTIYTLVGESVNIRIEKKAMLESGMEEMNDSIKK